MSPRRGEVGAAAGEIRRRRRRARRAMAALLQPLDQGLGIDALDRRLAGGIDRRDEDDVGIVEGALELVHQIVQPGVAVRLDDRDHPPLRALARRRQHRLDLDRMVAVIVDDGRRRRPRRPW